jgi:hypothetical protein
VIDEDDLDVVWDMINQSLAQMPYDEKSNANKKRANEERRGQTFPSSSTITINANQARTTNDTQ